MNTENEYRQMIIIRKDLNMRRGKQIVQGAHASMKATLLHINDSRVQEWLKGPFAKICVSVDSEEEFNELCEKAKNAGLICEEIIDAGRTEFNGVPTKTALGIGPDTKENLDKITGHLKLL